MLHARILEHVEVLWPSLWIGFASVIDVAGGLGARLRHFADPAADVRALRGDWAAVAGDLRGATRGR